MSKSLQALVLLACMVLGLQLLANKLTLPANLVQEQSAEAVRQKLDALKRDGFPVEVQEMEALYQQHTDPKNADAWQVIFAHLKTSEFRALTQGIEEFDREVKGTRRTQESWPAEALSRRLLAETTELRKTIHRLASDKTAVRFPTQFGSLNDGVTENCRSMRDILGLVSLELDATIQDQDSAATFESLKALFQLAHVLDGHPSSLTQLIGINARQLGFLHIKELLGRDQIDLASLESIVNNLPPEPLANGWIHNSLNAERVLGTYKYREIRKGTGNLYGDLELSLETSPLDFLHYLEYLEQCQKLLHLPMAQAILQSKALESRLAETTSSDSGAKLREWHFTVLLAPPISKLVEAHCRDCQQLNMVLHGIAIRRYQDEFGEFPRDLFALQNVGFDTLAHMPVGDKPMGYRLEGNEAVLWSTPLGLGLETTPEPIIADKTSVLTYDPTWEQMTWRFAP